MISTLMQPIVNQNDLFVDNNEQPLVHGRLDFLDPVSNNLINVYSYTDDEYTILTNPVILDIYGRAEQSVFSDSLTYCRLYAYRGLDEHNQPIYDFVREWYAGHDAQSAISDTVYGIEALRNLDPEYNKNVMVVGYYNEHDCGPRRYYWDENSTLDIDNIYIVGSKNTSVGRWILNFDGEYLPSTYAGVYPGNTANINALLSYVEVINGKRTAPGVWFVPGEYSDSTVALITTKKLLIDNSTSFSYKSITSNDDIKIVGGKTDHFITDLYGVKTAHSSWYKTLQGFLDSGAKELIFDASNNFTQASVMTKNTTLSNVHLVNNTNMYAEMGFNNFTLTLDRCTVDDHLFYPSTSRIFFQNMLVTDRYFYGPNVNNMDISRINADNIYLCNFDNAAIYLKWMYQKGNTDIDMQGRIVSDIDYAPSLTGLHNCRFNTLTLNDSSKTVFLENCQGILRSLNSANLIIYNCRLTLDTNLALTQGGFLNIKDSDITGTGDIQAGADFAMMIVNSTLEPSITCPYVTNINEQLYNVIVIGSTVGNIEAKRLEMTNSKASTIKIYGSATARGNTIGNVKLENNVIDNFGFFSVTNFESTVNNCTFVDTRIVNNTFNNSFTCPFYVTGSDSNKYEFISSTGNHEYLYRGNHGQCPIDSTQLVTTLPYTDGAYKDAAEHEWPLELTHTFRMFLPGERLVKGTILGAKMVEMFTSYGSDTQVINPLNYGLFHAGSLDASDNDYFQMCLANDFPALDVTAITQINMNGV